MDTKQTTTYQCPKCAGTGYLNQYAGIAGGVCFSCEGRGHKVGRAPVPGTLFGISAIRKADGVRIDVFNKKAKTADEALKKAVQTLRGGIGYVPESAQVSGP